MNHLDANELLNDKQHGFRAKRSCETQLILTLDDFASAIDKCLQTDIAILDFTKAFDSVAHQRLFVKLRYYGINGIIIIIIIIIYHSLFTESITCHIG